MEDEQDPIRQLFLSLDVSTLESFVAESRGEDLHLEFKTARSALRDRNESKLLARSLSAFANADGGIIVWGVDARRNADQVDCATELMPMERLGAFLTRLRDLSTSAVNPFLANVEHRQIQRGPDDGFAATYVPAGEGGPYMAKGGEDRYYRRGDGISRKMEHYEIADMFGRRARPVLEVYHRIVPRSHSNNQVWRYSIVVGLRNTGRGSARVPFLSLSTPTGMGIDARGLDGKQNFGLRPLFSRGAKAHLFGGAGDTVIHSGVDLDVAPIEARFDANASSLPVDVVLDCRVAAEDFPMIEVPHRVTGADILHGLRSEPFFE